MFLNKIYKPILTVLLALLFGFFPFISGCDDSGVITEGPDTNVVIFKDLIVNYYVNAINDTLFIAADLWRGVIVRQQDTLKDMTLIDEPIGSNQNFRFRSGDQVLDAPGKQTRFYRNYENMTQQRFDTLSKIDYFGTLDSTDFTADDTYGNGAWGYFNAPLSANPVYSFWLKGKQISGITPKPIYGLFYIKNAIAGAGQFSLTFDVKINKNGEDKFVQ